MTGFVQILRCFCCLAVPFTALGALAADPGGFDAGPAYAKFALTLSSGWREEAAGPFYYWQDAGGQEQWALPPFFCQTRTPAVDWSEWDLFYPVLSYRRFGPEYRFQAAQLLSLSGGQQVEGAAERRVTLFPVFFSQRSPDTNLNYTALVPFYGHLQNRLLRDRIDFVLFPLYSETRKNDVVTDNYLYPIFDLRHGDGMTGWQVWPLAGAEHKAPTLRTNLLDEVTTNGGYEKSFALWPFYFDSRLGLGTTNPASSITVVPFFSQTLSPSRDQTSYGWPFGYNVIDDREQNYSERDLLWPLFVRARGSKTVDRCFPFYSRALNKDLESDFYAWPFYKFNRLQAPPLDRRRTRLLGFLYSDTVELNTQNGQEARRVDFWPFYSFHRDKDGSRRLQALALLEPFFPNNRAIRREYSQLWSVWRSEENALTGATSQSLLWNLYRREQSAESKKTSLLFGLFQYQSTLEGGCCRVCGVAFGKKTAATPKS
jgi:hypothetical protein